MEFSWTGIVIGAFTGMLVGLILSMVLKPNLLRAQLCGAAGLALGALVEGVRFWWRKRKRRRLLGADQD